MALNATTAALTITANDRTKTEGTTLTSAPRRSRRRAGRQRRHLERHAHERGRRRRSGGRHVPDRPEQRGRRVGHESRQLHGELRERDADGDRGDRQRAEGEDHEAGRGRRLQARPGPYSSSYKCASVNRVAVASCVGDVPNGSPIDTSTSAPTRSRSSAPTSTAAPRASRPLHVRYAWQGFFSIGNDPTQILNLVHAGDLIKLSFSLDGDRGLDMLAAGRRPPCRCRARAWPTKTSSRQRPGRPPGLSYSTRRRAVRLRLADERGLDGHVPPVPAPDERRNRRAYRDLQVQLARGAGAAAFRAAPASRIGGWRTTKHSPAGSGAWSR